MTSTASLPLAQRLSLPRLGACGGWRLAANPLALLFWLFFRRLFASLDSLLAEFTDPATHDLAAAIQSPAPAPTARTTPAATPLPRRATRPARLQRTPTQAAPETAAPPATRPTLPQPTQQGRPARRQLPPGPPLWLQRMLW